MLYKFSLRNCTFEDKEFLFLYLRFMSFSDNWMVDENELIFFNICMLKGFCYWNWLVEESQYISYCNINLCHWKSIQNAVGYERNQTRETTMCSSMNCRIIIGISSGNYEWVMRNLKMVRCDGDSERAASLLDVVTHCDCR